MILSLLHPGTHGSSIFHLQLTVRTPSWLVRCEHANNCRKRYRRQVWSIWVKKSPVR